jgi:PEP-CTERM motif
MKKFVISALALCLFAGTISASTVFTITQTPNFALSSSIAHTEQSWDFTVLAGWSNVVSIDSVKVTETFSGVTGEDQFQSTIINFAQPLGTASAIFFMFTAQSLATTETATFTPGSGGFTVADVTGSSVLGDFHTRVARNTPNPPGTTGAFTLNTIKIDITAETPEPATFALMGLGLAGIALIARRRA